MTIAEPRSRQMAVIGVDHAMPDARERVVGTLRYTVDHIVEGMAYGRLVRSPYPHALIESIDTSTATAMEGVLAVITGADLLASELVPNPYFGLARRDQPPLAIGKVRYAGDPVALVVADSDNNARAAAAMVSVEYEELPYVVDPLEAAAPGAPIIHEDWPENQCGEWALHRGDVELAMAGAAHVFEAVYTSPPASALPFEPFVAIARWSDRGLELWSSTQWPSAVQKELAHMFDLDLANVRVAVFPLGGGFGAKGQIKIEPLVAAGARLANVPLKIEFDRDEVFLTTCKHPAWMRIRTGVDADGRFLARDIDLVYNAGAYAGLSPSAVAQGMLRSPGPYRVPNVRLRSRGVYTNTVPSGSFRGAMTNQPAFGYESHADEIASALGIDPLAIRLANVARDGDVYPSGQVMHDVHFAELLINVAGAIGWDEEAAPARAGRARGKGIAVVLKTTPPGSRSEVRIQLNRDGRLHVFTSSVDMGQGLKGTIAQLAAHHLGIAYEAVSVNDPDTALTGFDSMTAGSRTTFVQELALREAVADLQRQLSELAASQLGVEPGDLRHHGGGVAVISDSSRAATYPDLLAAAAAPHLSAEGTYQGPHSMALAEPDDVHGEVSVHWHQGAVAVEVEVDLETGRTEVLRCHGAAWAGRVINPTRARQQSEGSIIFGIGPALFEELIVADGQVSNPNMSDYMIPSIMDVPIELTSSSLESDDEDPEIHGVGEMTIPAVAPAIANAVAAAVGIRVRHLPLTAERVLRGMVAGEGTA